MYSKKDIFWKKIYIQSTKSYLSYIEKEFWEIQMMVDWRKT